MEVTAVLVESVPIVGTSGFSLAPRCAMRNNRRTLGRIWPARVFVPRRMRELTSLDRPGLFCANPKVSFRLSAS